MKILLLDTSGPVCGVAVASDGDLVYESWMNNKMTHSQKIMPMVDAALRMLDLDITEIDAYAAVTGPGSFTGVRIGVATVKGLAEARQKPCVEVDALEALARNAGAFTGTVCPILDARAGQVYGAAFRAPTFERLLPDQALKLEEFLSGLESCGGPYLFVGDGIKAHRAGIEAKLGADALFAAPDYAQLRPGCAIMLAVEKLAAGDVKTADALLPLYLRAPQAERERAARLAAEKA